MEARYSERMAKVKKSFIREILKVTADPSVISFAGGLPNPISFPQQALADAAQKVLQDDGANVLQYSTTEGYLPLRQFIADRYFKRFGLIVDPEEILITNGSQQGLDLLGKVFLDKGDTVLLERPAYLGAIQALSIFEPEFYSVGLRDDGVDIIELEEQLKTRRPKIFYAVPNFQNPSGLSYSIENRKKTAELLAASDTILIEDDPYGELRFSGENAPSMKNFNYGGTVLLGSFSKIVSPAMRLGWICAEKGIMERLIVAKQAADLHSNYFSQRVLFQYLADNDLDGHISKIKCLYKIQSDCMVTMIRKYFPNITQCTKPEGGMFMWVTLPAGVSSLKLFDLASKRNVAFVPGDPFYTDKTDTNTFRLNYTNADERMIEEGIRRLASAINEMLV